MTRINACRGCNGHGVVHGETCGACHGLHASTRAEGLAMANMIRDATSDVMPTKDAGDLAKFFLGCISIGRRLDKPVRADDDPITRVLMQIIGAAKTGYWEVTERWPPGDAELPENDPIHRGFSK